MQKSTDAMVMSPAEQSDLEWVLSTFSAIVLPMIDRLRQLSRGMLASTAASFFSVWLTRLSCIESPTSLA
jgi:hypothetical protein